MIIICSKRIARAYKNKHNGNRQNCYINVYFIPLPYFTNHFYHHTVIIITQQQQQQLIIPIDQLVPKFQRIGRCNNYVVLQNIPCLPECKIMGQLLLDHPLSYAFTATADVLVVYLQQFWNTVSKLPVETPANPFIAPATMTVIEPFMQTVDYQGVCDKIIIADLMKKYSSIPQRLEHDYHSIKDDILPACIYSMGNVTVRGMLIPDAFITDEIHATDDYKEYEIKKKRIQVAEETSSLRKLLKVTIKQKQERTTPIPPPSYDKERDEIVKEKFEEEEIANMVEGDVVIVNALVLQLPRQST
ncbi:hypothetical protein Tco_1420305 [Tanacetum coccineum]